MNSACAGPPTRNQVSGASGSLGRSRPRRAGRRACRSATMSVNVRTERAPWRLASRHLANGGKLAGQRVGPLRDAAGAEAHHDVAGERQPPDDAREVLRTIERDHLTMAARAQALHE